METKLSEVSRNLLPITDVGLSPPMRGKFEGEQLVAVLSLEGPGKKNADVSFNSSVVSPG